MERPSRSGSASDLLNGTSGAAETAEGWQTPLGSDHHDPEATDANAWPQRIWWLLTGFLLIDWAIRLQGASVPLPFVALAVVLIGAFGLMCIVEAATHSSARAARHWDSDYAWLILVVFLVAYGLFSYVGVKNSPGLGTDEIAFNQYAAQLTAHGANPYTHSMAPSFPLYGVSPDGWTYHLNGQPVTNLSYPSLSFLFYVPFIWLGWTTQLATTINMLAWAVAIVILFVLLGPKLRPAALLLGTIATFTNYAFGGVTDFIYIPFLIVALYRWDRFTTDAGWKRYVGPVCLGICMAIKQTPWVIFPFMLIAISLESWPRIGRRSALQSAGRYAAVAMVAFLIPNLPFLILSPGSWLHAVLTPVEGSLVPAGQGPIALTLFMRIGGGSLLAYTAMMGFVFVALLALFIVSYPRLRSMIAVTPAVILFFSSRSFGSYLVATLPALLIAVASTDWASGPLAMAWQGPEPEGRTSGPRHFSPRLQRSVFGIAAAGLLVFTLLTFTSAPPLRIEVHGVRTTGSLSTIQDIAITATNTSSRVVRPHFTVAQNGGAVTTFWQTQGGPPTLGPGQTASYTLAATNLSAEAPITGYFSVVAYTQHPNTVSVSNTFLPNHMHVALTPIAIDTPIPVGQSVVIHAVLRDQYDKVVSKRGVPVYLGQIIYDQSGIQNSNAIVNGQPPGTSPVMAETDSDGVATFVVVGTQAGPDPVSFQSNLRDGGANGYPYGYSTILTVQFASPG